MARSRAWVGCGAVDEEEPAGFGRRAKVAAAVLVAVLLFAPLAGVVSALWGWRSGGQERGATVVALGLMAVLALLVVVARRALSRPDDPWD